MSRSAESIRALGLAAHGEGDTGLLRELLSELTKFRGTPEARRVTAELAPLLEDPDASAANAHEPHGHSEPSRQWLSGIRAVASRFRASQSGSRTVYLVLLHNPEHPAQFGVYVGRTGLTAEERFANHKRGYKTKKYMTQFAVRLLTPHFAHLREISDEEATEIEVALADALNDAGYWVKGGR